MNLTLEDIYVDPIVTEAAEEQVEDRGEVQGKNDGPALLLGFIILIVIVVSVILVRTVRKETKVKKTETDNPEKEEIK